MSRMEEIAARLTTTTPGPWVRDGTTVATRAAALSGHRVASTGTPGDLDDATFIAAAPADIAYLLKRVKQLEGIAERLVAAIDDLPVQSMTAHLADNHAGAKTALACAHHA